jgi:hypothetical protein
MAEAEAACQYKSVSFTTFATKAYKSCDQTRHARPEFTAFLSTQEACAIGLIWPGVPVATAGP